MATLLEQLEEIKSVLGGVPDIGKVYVGLRYAPKDAQVKQLYFANGRLNAWVITRERTQARDNAPTYRRDRHKVLIRAWYSVEADEDSEMNFQTLIEAVRAAFDPNPIRHLNGKARILTPVQVESAAGMELFLGSYLCWAARLGFEMENF